MVVTAAVAMFLLITVVESTIALKLLRTVVLMMLIEDKECPGWCNSADRESNDLRSLTTMYTVEYELINNHTDLYLFFIRLEKSLLGLIQFFLHLASELSRKRREAANLNHPCQSTSIDCYETLLKSLTTMCIMAVSYTHLTLPTICSV